MNVLKIKIIFDFKEEEIAYILKKYDHACLHPLPTQYLEYAVLK